MQLIDDRRAGMGSISAEVLPQSVRYVKNGPGGRWWPTALAKGEIHAGWDGYPDEAILSRDLERLRSHHKGTQQDLNALYTLLKAGNHIWVTIQSGYLWWYTVNDHIGIDPDGSAEVGRTTEGIDIEAQNAATGEVAFVQVKSAASQAVLDGYVLRLNERREQYTRMIFAVHSPQGEMLTAPGGPIQVWNGRHTADLVVSLGLSKWLSGKV